LLPVRSIGFYSKGCIAGAIALRPGRCAPLRKDKLGARTAAAAVAEALRRGLIK